MDPYSDPEELSPRVYAQTANQKMYFRKNKSTYLPKGLATWRSMCGICLFKNSYSNPSSLSGACSHDASQRYLLWVTLEDAEESQMWGQYQTILAVAFIFDSCLKVNISRTRQKLTNSDSMLKMPNLMLNALRTDMIIVVASLPISWGGTVLLFSDPGLNRFQHRI